MTEVVATRRVLENGRCLVSLPRAKALHGLLRVEACIGPRSRHFRALRLILRVVKARLGRIEAGLRHVVRQQHAVALVLTIAWGGLRIAKEPG